MPPAPRRAAYRRLSESPLWAAQRRYYERAGIDAWRTGTVPHHVTSNVALAMAYAKVVRGFLRDTGRQGLLDVLELGAGSGRFAFLFLRACDALGLTSVRYVMTDLARSTITAWRHHAALGPFVRAGRLAFARLDLAAPEFSRPRMDRNRAGSRQARSARANADLTPPRSAGADAQPALALGVRPAARRARGTRLVVIANYVFSGLPHDAYVCRAGTVRTCLVAVKPQRGDRRAAGRPSSRNPAPPALAWRIGERVSAPDRADELDRIPSACASGHVLVPVGALRVLDRLVALGDDVLVLVADRGTEEAIDVIAPAHDFGVAHHGAISFPVNFPALRSWVARHGGLSLRPGRQQPALHLAAFVLGARAEWPATRRAYDDTMRAGGPAAVYGLRRALAIDGDRVTPEIFRSLLKRAGPDPRVIAECARPLWPHLVDAGPRFRREVERAVLGAWPNYYHVDERDDVPFTLGLLLYEVRAYEAARALFRASLRFHGDDAATWWNLGLCAVARGRPATARAAFRRARGLAPARHAAGLAMVKAGRAPTTRVRPNATDP